MAATLALGFWQLGRGQQRLALEAAIEARHGLPPIDAAALLQAPGRGELLHRQVVLRGRWSARHTVYLDNRQMQGRPGFYVVTPLRLAGSDAAVLVQRGWAARDFNDRQRLPAVETPDGEVELHGRIAPPPAKLYAFETAEAGLIRQNLDLASFRAETGLSLLDGSVVQTGAASQGLLRDWPAASSGAGKNFGYAFQWWALCGLIAILYVWFQFIAPRRRSTPV
ncbi:MAG TPA: SURF1 family protein [Ramlibacter sp.]|nr:SURF1 family protein [Ramlibacter sp.]